MADLICRWRNGSPKTVVELVNSMPHEKMNSNTFRSLMNSKWDGDFFRTPYQLACQLGLYCEAEDECFYPRFDRDITEQEALDYLLFWIPRYYIPNPYTASGGFENLECPTYVLKSLYDYAIQHPSCNYKDAYQACFKEPAKNNDDIIRNYINNFSRVLTCSKDGRLEATGVKPEEVFSFMDRTDKKAFFDSFDNKDAVVINNVEPKDYTEQDFISILKDFIASGISYPVHTFGFKYGKIIKDKGLNSTKIIEAVKGKTSMDIEFQKGCGIAQNILDEKFGLAFYHGQNIIENDEKKTITRSKQKDEIPYVQNHTQLIYYGVPGCGKSHKIKKLIDEKILDKEDQEQQVHRVVFHPDYTNSDFVGQILPEVKKEGGVEYTFKAGPFTEILRKAYTNPSKPYFLIIEEINRGNAAAIFGEIFQLLDRKKSSSEVEIVNNNIYGAGWSDYCINNDYINAYFRRAFDENVNDSIQNVGEHSSKLGNITVNSLVAIRLPPNLSIYATMNTSDQNVFTLDNAFQRRWEMKLIDNSCKWDDNDHKNQALAEIRETGICWEAFRDTINKKIAEAKVFNADDKQLGLFFMEAEGDGANKKIDPAKFANKVLKYLWTDVFKRDRDGDGIFLAKNMSDLVNNFNESDAFKKTFKENFIGEMMNTDKDLKAKYLKDEQAQKSPTESAETSAETPIVNDESQSA